MSCRRTGSPSLHKFITVPVLSRRATRVIVHTPANCHLRKSFELFCLSLVFIWSGLVLIGCMHSRFGAPPRVVTWVTSRARDGAPAACRGQQKHRSQSFWSGFGLCSTAYMALVSRGDWSRGGAACDGAASFHTSAELHIGCSVRFLRWASRWSRRALLDCLDHCSHANWYHFVPMVEVWEGVRSG